MSEIRTLAQAAAAVEATLGTPPTPGGRWSWGQILVHCAQSIECSMDGFPALKPAILRATIGSWVGQRFLRKNRLSHDTGASIPGVDDPAPIELCDAWARLRDGIERFEAFEGELQPHFVFGALGKADFDRLHALHIADHLRALS